MPIKIISTLTQNALNAKVDLSGNNVWTGANSFNTSLPTSTLTPTTANQLVTKAYCDLKAPLESPSFTGNITANNGLFLYGPLTSTATINTTHIGGISSKYTT